jgi:CheY-like chemotaxis protein
VLIADNSASSRELLRSILEARGYTVGEAGDGVQVLAMIDFFAPHLVILDLQMPLIDGFATIAALRRKPELQGVPIIALSAAITLTVPEDIREAGFSAYLVKPIRPSDLRRCVATMLQGPRL